MNGYEWSEIDISKRTLLRIEKEIQLIDNLKKIYHETQNLSQSENPDNILSNIIFNGKKYAFDLDKPRSNRLVSTVHILQQWCNSINNKVTNHTALSLPNYTY